MVEFRALGPLEVSNGSMVCTPTSPKVRKVLAMLLLSANRVVLVDTIIRELWGDEPMKSAVTTVQTYIYHLRKSFVRHGIGRTDRDLLVSRSSGYLLRVAPGELDTDRFGTLFARGRACLAAGEYDRGAAVLRQAIDLWSGPALSNVSLGVTLEAQAIHLDEQRLRALELRIEADMALGRHRELVGELRYLTMTHPLNEWFHRQLMLALGACGRRAEALAAYRQLRTVLEDELGLDPSPEAQRIHQELLAGGHTEIRSYLPDRLGEAG